MLFRFQCWMSEHPTLALAVMVGAFVSHVWLVTNGVETLQRRMPKWAARIVVTVAFLGAATLLVFFLAATGNRGSRISPDADGGW